MSLWGAPGRGIEFWDDLRLDYNSTDRIMTQNDRIDTNDTLARNRAAMARFLEKFRDSGNIRLSCRAADVSRKTVYRWRNKWATFAAEWDEAKEDACDILEGEAWKRAIKNQSDRLLMFLLKAHRREVYGDKVAMEHTGKDGQPIEHRIPAFEKMLNRVYADDAA